ncbi:MAG: DNA double-strand break repair nuclease NurA [Meiothermus sp.]|nr:DNA double-strand break repair nuclease NurA [Meiothermus sp.]
MAYRSKTGRRPDEAASKSSHSYVINDPVVQKFLGQCKTPKRAEEIQLDKLTLHVPLEISEAPITHIVAVDGGYTEVTVQAEFPSATMAFFQFGALFFSVKDLENLDHQPFIDPDDISKLRNIQRLKLAIPVKNIAYGGEATLTHSIRRALYEFCCHQPDEQETFAETLRWLIFEEFGQAKPTWLLSSCPYCGKDDPKGTNLLLERTQITRQYTFICSNCGKDIYITDVMRLHEAIDDELGAGGILGYLTTTLEQLVLAHLIRLVLKTKPDLMKKFLFIKDGPLAFFGQTANLHKPMRELVAFLLKHHNIFMAGLEKSGAFVDHAHEVAKKLPKGMVLLLDNDYIYKYIIPGRGDEAEPYGRTTYYGKKLIFKTTQSQVYVASLPSTHFPGKPEPASADQYPNLHIVLSYLEKLRCDMYDNSLIPIALANKLVSLSNHPSAKILQRFAIERIG